jgi:hypothetical protein
LPTETSEPKNCASEGGQDEQCAPFFQSIHTIRVQSSEFYDIDTFLDKFYADSLQEQFTSPISFPAMWPMGPEK